VPMPATCRGIILIAALLTFVCQPVLADTVRMRIDFDQRSHYVLVQQGIADPATGRAATVDDPVRVASVSKLIVALGVMRLVEQRRLSLDRDVSDYLGWQLRNPHDPGATITLRMLLSHRSGLNDAADYIIPLGGSLRATVGSDAAWDKDHKSGSFFRYANLNYAAIGTVLEAATKTRFDQLMTQQVFAPLKMDACFNWSNCSAQAVQRGIVLTSTQGAIRKDAPDQRPGACAVLQAADGSCNLASYIPGTNGALFSPQGGLRISARDLVRIGQVLMARGSGFLKASSIDTLMHTQWRFNGQNGDTENGLWCRYALAVQWLATRQPGCRDDPFGDGVTRLGHPGEAYGLRSGLWIDPKQKRGVVIVVTAVEDGSTGAISAFSAPEEALLAK
jgi:CubicO group peptidase (beta-lactamase class C family)